MAAPPLLLILRSKQYRDLPLFFARTSARFMYGVWIAIAAILSSVTNPKVQEAYRGFLRTFGIITIAAYALLAAIVLAVLPLVAGLLTPIWRMLWLVREPLAHTVGISPNSVITSPTPWRFVALQVLGVGLQVPLVVLEVLLWLLPISVERLFTAELSAIQPSLAQSLDSKVVRTAAAARRSDAASRLQFIQQSGMRLAMHITLSWVTTLLMASTMVSSSASSFVFSILVPQIPPSMATVLGIVLLSVGLSWSLPAVYCDCIAGMDTKRSARFHRRHQAVLMGFASVFGVLMAIPVIGPLAVGLAFASTAHLLVCLGSAAGTRFPKHEPVSTSTTYAQPVPKHFPTMSELASAKRELAGAVTSAEDVLHLADEPALLKQAPSWRSEPVS